MVHWLFTRRGGWRPLCQRQSWGTDAALWQKYCNYLSAMWTWLIHIKVCAMVNIKSADKTDCCTAQNQKGLYFVILSHQHQRRLVIRELVKKVSLSSNENLINSEMYSDALFTAFSLLIMWSATPQMEEQFSISFESSQCVFPELFFLWQAEADW